MQFLTNMHERPSMLFGQYRSVFHILKLEIRTLSCSFWKYRTWSWCEERKKYISCFQRHFTHVFCSFFVFCACVFPPVFSDLLSVLRFPRCHNGYLPGNGWCPYRCLFDLGSGALSSSRRVLLIFAENSKKKNPATLDLLVLPRSQLCQSLLWTGQKS